MTRKEEIKKQAEKKTLEPSRLMHPYAKQHKVMSAYEIGFIEGAVWADEHPSLHVVASLMHLLRSGRIDTTTTNADVSTQLQIELKRSK